jgi:hypothetical protein
MSKIIEINVGGNVYSTTNTTLLSEPESILALLEQNELIPRDERNRPFFDRDGQIFRYILEYLRSKSSFILPENDLDKMRLKNEAEYFKLASLVELIETNLKDESNLCKSLIQAKKSSGCIVGTEIKGKGFSYIRITIFLISELCITVFHISNFNVPPFKGSNLVSFRENFKGYLK